MEAKLKNDRRILGALILFKILEKKSLGIREQKSIWDEFQGFSKVLGDDFMDFLDFEHFYLKLEKGECELDYDGKPTHNRNLCDMPPHIFKLITDKLTSKEKFVLRETSSSLRRTIAPCEPENKKLIILISENRGLVYFHNDDGHDSPICIEYSEERSEEAGELKVHRSSSNYSFENSERSLNEAMIRDIRHLLKKPKTRLVELQIRSHIHDDSFFDRLKPLLESQEGIRNVYIVAKSAAHFHFNLSCLKPETLEEIELDCPLFENLDFSGIVEMDQVKHSKRVKIRCHCATYPLSQFMHLDEFEGGRNRLEPEEVLEIKNELTRTGKMKKFIVKTAMEMSLPRINELLGPLNPEFNDAAERRHFRIQNSDEFMKLEIKDREIEFHRVTTVENEIPIN